MARNYGLQTTNSIKSPVPSRYADTKDPHGQTWEDLLQDEKIEKLMHTVTYLWNRCEALERQNNDLRRHSHNSDGWPVIQRGIGEDSEIDTPGRVNRNPFNSKQIEDEGPF